MLSFVIATKVEEKSNKAASNIKENSAKLGEKAEEKINKTGDKLDKAIDKVVVQPAKEVIQATNEYRNKYDGISTIDLAVAATIVNKNPDMKEIVESNLDRIERISPIDHKVVEDPTQWGPWMALAGSQLIQMPDAKLKLAGIALMTPQGLISGGSAVNKWNSGDYEGAIQDGAVVLTLGLFGGIALQDSKGLLIQTTGKESNKFFNRGDGIYTLENGTSQGLLSGNDFVRVNLVNGVATNAYGRLGGNTVMLDRTSAGTVPGTSLISSGITNVLGLSGTSQTNAGSLTYTPTEIRPSQIFISNPVTGVTEVFHNALTDLKPTFVEGNMTIQVTPNGVAEITKVGNVDKGHLVERHAGWTDQELVNRVITTNISGASTFINDVTMDNTLKNILWNGSNLNNDISNWLYNSTTLRFKNDYTMNSVIGKGVYPNDLTNMIDLTRVRIILDREEEFFIPKTFYPIR